MKILLVTRASGQNHSIEAGLADGLKNFDHHKEHGGNPAPCNDSRIGGFKDGNDIVEITHTDADTLLGLMRLLGMKLPNIDMSVVEKIDLNGSSSVPLDNVELAYMVGTMGIVMDSNVPRPSTEPQDVTSVVTSILSKMSNEENVINLGKEKIEKSEGEYQKATKYSPVSNVVAIACPKETQIDPSRPYSDGFDVVVFFREQYKSISLYASPRTKVDFVKNPVYAGIKFAGHPKACGSPRGEEFSWKDTIAVATDVSNRISQLMQGE